jgi:hypothetical protein
MLSWLRCLSKARALSRCLTSHRRIHVSRPTGMPHKDFVSTSRRASQAVTWFSAMTLPTVSRFLVFMGMPSVDNTQNNQPGYLASLRHYLPALTLTWRIRGRTCRKRIASGRAPARKGV